MHLLQEGGFLVKINKFLPTGSPGGRAVKPPFVRKGWLHPVTPVICLALLLMASLVLNGCEPDPGLPDRPQEGEQREESTAEQEQAADQPGFDGDSLADEAAVESGEQDLVDQCLIVFTSFRDGDAHIYVMNPDGSNQVPLTTRGNNGFPAWSPDGRKVIFLSDQDDPYRSFDIYVYALDDGSLSRLTDNDYEEFLFAWSPDGAKIAFVSDRDEFSNSEIYVMDADGSNQTRLTETADYTYNTKPVWSPDGKQILYETDGFGHGEVGKSIFVFDADGSNQRRLTDNEGSDQFAVWSPDGQQIAFVSNRDEASHREYIYIMDADGSNMTRLTQAEPYHHEESPAWSPDGRRIAYESLFEIFVIDVNGANQVLLSDDGRYENPRWSPCGEFIVCNSTDGVENIYLIYADGSGMVPLTAYDSRDNQAAFSPACAP